MEEKYNAVVIRTTNYKENDKIINLFTLENGLISASLKGVKKATSKLKFAGEMFCFGEFVLIESSGRRTVKEVNQIDSFYNIRLDVDKLYASSVMAELISKLLIDDMKSYELFLCFINALKTLDKSSVSARLTLITFCLYAMRFQGYKLSFDKCSECRQEIKDRVFFSFSEGRSLCLNCARNLDTEIRFSTYELLKRCSFVTGEISFDHLLDIKEDEITEINALRFINFALNQIVDINLKSLKYFID